MFWTMQYRRISYDRVVAFRQMNPLQGPVNVLVRPARTPAPTSSNYSDNTTIGEDILLRIMYIERPRGTGFPQLPRVVMTS
jgi:hypothetical protein